MFEVHRIKFQKLESTASTNVSPVVSILKPTLEATIYLAPIYSKEKWIIEKRETTLN